MQAFRLPPCREIGVLKTALKDAILDGVVPNEREAAWQFVLDKAEEMGLETNLSFTQVDTPEEQ